MLKITVLLEHELKLKQRRQKYATKKSVVNDENSRVKKFKQSVLEGPYYICVVCNRCLYRRSVVLFKSDGYDICDPEFYFSLVQSYDGSSYVCHTCHRKIKAKKIQIPCQAVCNKLEVFKVTCLLNY